MKVGNVSLNPEAFRDWTKEQFFSEYTGKLDRDKEEVWKDIVAINKKHAMVLPKEIADMLGLKGVENGSSNKTGSKSKKPDS